MPIELIWLDDEERQRELLENYIAEECAIEEWLHDSDVAASLKKAD